MSVDFPKRKTRRMSQSIDLASGHPSPALIPIQHIQKAANHALSNPAIWQQGTNYGPDAGYIPLRQNLSRWLASFYASDRGKTENPDVERICVTGGASQNLANILQVYTDPVQTRRIFVVEPAYFLSFRIFEDAGFGGRLKGVPEDKEGVDLKALEDALKQEVQMPLHEGKSPKLHVFKQQKLYRKLYTHVIYCVPTFSNPSGRIMSLSRRQELVRLARKYDALLIADDVYDFVYWKSNPSASADASLPHSPLSSSLSISSSASVSSSISGSPVEFTSLMPRLVDIDATLDGEPIDEFGNCISNGSFSKIVGPGCRVGWAEGTPAFIYGLSQVGSTRSGGAPSQLVSTFISDMLENGSITEHIHKTLAPAYARRFSKITSAIKQYLAPIGVTLPSLSSADNGDSLLNGGFFIWLQLPSSLRAREVAAAASPQGLIVGEGTSSALPDGNVRYAEYEDMLRLCFACVDEFLLTEAVVILRRVILECLAE